MGTKIWAAACLAISAASICSTVGAARADSTVQGETFHDHRLLVTAQHAQLSAVTHMNFTHEHLKTRPKLDVVFERAAEPVFRAADVNEGAVQSATSFHNAAAQSFLDEDMGVVISDDAGLSTLDLEDLARIYAGEITNWNNLGGNDMQIHPIIVKSGSPEYLALVENVLTPFGRKTGDGHTSVRDGEQAMALVKVISGSVAVLPVGQISGIDPILLVDACDCVHASDVPSKTNG